MDLSTVTNLGIGGFSILVMWWMKDLMGRQELTIPLSKLIKEKEPADQQPVDLSHLM